MPAVAILKGVDVYESESGRCGLQYGIDFSVAHALVRRDHTLHEDLQIIGARADKFR